MVYSRGGGFVHTNVNGVVLAAVARTSPLPVSVSV
jgi:hypothetical protein